MIPKNFFKLLALGLSVSIGLSSCGGGSSSSSTSGGGGGGGTNQTPTPTITSISPTKITAGTGNLTLTVNGTNFLSSTIIEVGGIADPTTYVSATQVTATVAAAQVASGSQLTIVAVNGSSGNSSAAGTAISLEVDNPAPTITQLVPASAYVGQTGAVIAVSGTGFVPATVIQVNGAARTTTFVSSTQVNVLLSADDVAKGGSLSLTAVNPAPGGGTSGAATVSVSNPTPQVSKVSPDYVLTNAIAPVIVTVNGSNFVPTSTVQVGGTARTTTFVSTSQLTFQLAASDLTSAQRLLLSVNNPTPGGGTVPAGALFVLAPTPAPVINQVQPSSFLVGSGDQTITIYGSNLEQLVAPNFYYGTATVLWNGTALTGTGYFSGGGSQQAIMAQVPASLLATAGTATVTVQSVTSNPATSNGVQVSITNPPAPTLTGLYPANGPTNTATKVTLNGTGFTASSTVALNGVTIPSTYVSYSQITATIPASATALPGNVNLTVTTPAPGGGTTAPLPYTAYVAIANNDMVFNSVNGLFYVSVPSSAGAPYGNCVVSVNPATGALGTPIQVGSEPGRLAITDDGRYLWVGLDGASSVRKVDLKTGTAGLQFYLGGNGGIYQSPTKVQAMAALPGSTDSVVISSGFGLGIYDSGILRGTITNNTPQALQVDGSKSEVYAAGGNGYTVYTYSSSGLTVRGTGSSSIYVNYGDDELVVADGKLFTSQGRVYDAEAGALLGTFYAASNVVANGPVAADTAQGLAFILDSAQQYSYTYTQIQGFKIADFTAATTPVLPVSVTDTPMHLTRWGSNGIAFNTMFGVYSFRSNSIKDLSGTSADLAVKVTASGGATTGTTATYTATVTNNGPTAATDVTLVAQLPSTGEVMTASSSAGSCAVTEVVSCHLGGVASGGTATVTITVLQSKAGDAKLNAAVSASENDPDNSNNNSSATVTVTGADYALVPLLSTISPSAIEAGASDTMITVTGANFSSGATVMLGSTALVTTFTDAGTLTATVPAGQAAAMGWQPVTVTNPAPGGGASNAVPLTVFKVLTAGLNHIIYEPYSRKIYASVGSGSTSINANSIVPITPDTAAVGTAVYIGSQPTKMAISDDGNILYSLLGGANSVARFNLNTQTTEFTFSPTFTNYGTPSSGFRDIAIQTGSENTVAVDFGYTSGMGLFDIDPVAKTATERGAGTGLYTGTSLHFYDAQTLYLFNTDTWQTLDKYSITSSGFSYNSSHSSSTLLHFGTFQLKGKLGFADQGGVADVTTSPATQLGYFAPLDTGYGNWKVAADPSLGQVFFLAQTSKSSNYYSEPTGIVAYNQDTFMPAAVLPMDMATIEGNTSFTAVDLIRWGQDGLAALTSSGHLYLLRGAFVVPQLMAKNGAATLSSASSSTIAQGSGNQWITLTGSNFVAGVAVTWNGSYRTTEIVDATHVKVAIPATDLASAGTASVMATNPGGAASNALTITIQ